MVDNKNQVWAVVRLVTLQKRGEIGRLLFTTVTELTEGRPVPEKMSGLERFSLKERGVNLFFRRTILSKEDAVRWYVSLGEGSKTPIPTREEDREQHDGTPMRVSRLEDDQPWPAVGLPIAEEILSGSRRNVANPAPFIGSVPGRLHRRFGDFSGLEVFLGDQDAQMFVARRMHINLFDYQEYLGSAVYVSPDPIIKQIDNFMIPAKDGYGERIIYRIVPHRGQSLRGVRLTTFDKEARLLTSFKTFEVPNNGILEIDKGTCMGQYGFVVTHDEHGVLAYQPSVSFLRQMNTSIRIHSGNSLKVRVPSGDSPSAPLMEYEASMGSQVVSESIIGEVKNIGVGVRVNAAAIMREKLADAKYYGQHWFSEDSRGEAARFIQGLLRTARSKLMIADPYLGALQLGQFLYAVHGSEVAVTLMTTRLAFKPASDTSKNSMDLLEAFKHDLQNLTTYQKLVPEVKIISPSRLHDRFLVIDDEVWFLGNSLNSLGEKASMIVRLPNPNEVIERLQELGSKAPSLEAYLSNHKVRQRDAG